MPVSLLRTRRLALGLAACAAAAGCGSINSATYRFASSMAPYKIQVVQGNFVSREQVEALQPGMTRAQVREVLGSPLVSDVFHENRWDYVFTLRRQGVAAQERKLTLWFKANELERFEGDTMPSEAEFVATLDVKRRGSATVPVLEASEDKLRQFAPAATQPAPPPEPPAAASYPPLEPAAR